MKHKYFSTLILCLLLTGCAGMKVKDDVELKAELIKRVSEFQTSLINKDVKKAYAMTFASITGKSGTIQDNFVNSFKEGEHMSSYYQVDYKIKDVQVRNNKGRVNVKYAIIIKEGSKSEEADMFNFWTYENGEWYFLHGGKDAFFNLNGWWL